MRLFATLILLFSFSFAFSENKILIDATSKEINTVSEHVEIFLDSSNAIPFEKILNTNVFVPNEQQIINVGFNEASLWLKLSLSNIDLQEDKDFILEVGNSSLDVIEVYEVEGGQIINYQLLGDQVPFLERAIQFRNCLYPFRIEADSEKYLYLKIQTNGALQVPLTIATPTTFFINHLKTETAYGIYIGIMLVMVLYNILIFLSLKDLNYLYYAFPILANSTFFLSLSGHHFQYLFPNSPSVANNITVISIGAWILTSSFYAKSSLQSKKYSKVADIALITTMVLGGIGVLLPFVTSYAFAVRINSKFTLVNSLVMFVAGLLIWYKGNKSARFFILAWTAYLVGTFIFALMKFNFIEQNAFTKNVLAYGGVIEVLFLSLALSDKYKLYKREKEVAQKELLEQQLQANAVLEEKVNERTAELKEKQVELEQNAATLQEAFEQINNKNVELEQQNEEIVTQRDMVEKQKIHLIESSDKIQASINYAKRIQATMLPSLSQLKDLFPDSFLLFRPKDIVSGDFYWCAKVGNKKILAAVDCTGHGVPGAFMSLVGYHLLQDIVVKTKITSPEIILQALHLQIIKSLHQENYQLKDGMDMSLFVYDEKTKIFEFAGAHNPLVYSQGGEFVLIKGDRNSIGSTRPKVSFTNHKVMIDKETTLYLYSDGFQDQFGGPKDRKFGSKNFRAVLQENSALELGLQKSILESALDNWMMADENHHKQTDDILVIGVKLGQE
ncbi:7TM diverse intracellular signaling domain-containing protein [Flammeovirga aprica]|uniref:SpoIIE family protein phosphatase n=1 Tax=Flammeovirga aprica JL-4 TaxID=694437 RepID=A0A7X9P2Y8_9BACT|nr:7TM diverse intracellular signaling domain-containing protein [Flammeovirga aprica]NME68032.1 SpoIIE family protein phosphatase [Flammeovirga aprica JL-4]